MAKTRQQKQHVLDALQKDFAEAKAVVVGSFANISVNEDQAMRKELKSEGISYQVVKKTLLKKAFDAAGWEASLEGASGNVGVAVSATDEVAPARLMHKASKDLEGYEVVSGVMIQDGKVDSLDAAQVKALASLPSRDELIAKVVGSIGSPLRGLVTVLSGPQRGFVQTLRAISESK